MKTTKNDNNITIKNLANTYDAGYRDGYDANRDVANDENYEGISYFAMNKCR